MKGVPHYLPDGTLYKGKTHKHPDGSLMTGASMSKSSKKLSHKPAKAKTNGTVKKSKKS
jgi:hypothetical protein